MKNLKKFKDFIFESRFTFDIDLDNETREKYLKILEDMMSLPDLYKKHGKEVWGNVAGDVSYKDFIEYYENHISRNVYNSYKKKYREDIEKNPEKEKINEFIVSINGIFEDVTDKYSNKNIEWWIDEFAGFPINIPYIAKSLWDDINLIPIKFKKIR